MAEIIAKMYQKQKEKGSGSIRYLLHHGASEDVVSPTLLVRCNKVGYIDGRPRFEAAHVRSQLLLQGPFQHLRSLHCSAQIQ